MKNISKLICCRAETHNQTGESKGLDSFDLESLRVSQDFVKDSGVKLLTIQWETQQAGLCQGASRFLLCSGYHAPEFKRKGDLSCCPFFPG